MSAERSSQQLDRLCRCRVRLFGVTPSHRFPQRPCATWCLVTASSCCSVRYGLSSVFQACPVFQWLHGTE